jgi:hypothetical protein
LADGVARTHQAEGCAAVAAPARVAVPFEVDEMMPEVAIDGEVDDPRCQLTEGKPSLADGVARTHQVALSDAGTTRLK